MRSLRQILESGDAPSPTEVINIKAWLREYPHTDLAARLAERFPHLVEAADKGAGRR